MRIPILATYAVFATCFVATLSLQPYPGDFFIKAVPIIGLAVLAFAEIPGPRGKLMALAFVFSAAGDIVLQLDRDRYFVFGLGAFLVAHLFFVAAFCRRPTMAKYRGVAAMGIFLYCLGLGIVLVPRLGDLALPVAVYMVVICAMGIAAALGRTNHTMVVIGAALFIASDSMIAVNRFLVPLPFAGFLIMTTYYGGQLLIGLGAGRAPAAAQMIASDP